MMENFPPVNLHSHIELPQNKRWEVLLGDTNHYRLGVYRPEFSNISEINQYEEHDCVEVFILIEGAMSLVILKEGVEEVVELKKNTPFVVKYPHNGFCPNGVYTGTALVIERDVFETRYIPRN